MVLEARVPRCDRLKRSYDLAFLRISRIERVRLNADPTLLGRPLDRAFQGAP